MRKILILLLFAVAATNAAFGQMNNWAIAPTSYNMQTTALASTNIIPSTIAPLNNYNPEPNGACNGAYDGSGNLLFYINGNQVVQPGVKGTTFALPGFGYPLGETKYRSYHIGAEIAIVPVPGACNEFYIIYYISMADLAVGSIGYVKINAGVAPYTMTNATFTQAVGSTFPNAFSLPGGAPNSPNGGIAVSKVVSGAGTATKRFLYITETSGISRYDITNTGITNKQVVVNTSTTGFTGFGGSSGAGFNTCELELSDDGTKLAWGFYNQSVYIISLNATTGIYTPSSLVIKTIPSNGIAGLEFDATGNNLFICTDLTGSGVGGLYKTATSGSGTPVLVGAMGDLSGTQLERAKNGRIYGVRNASGVLSLVGLDPNSTTPFATALVTNLAAGTNIQHTGWYACYCLPDQIDGEDYRGNTGIAIAGNNINGSQPLTYCANSMQTWFNCSPMSFNAWYNYGKPAQYQLEIYEMGTSGSGNQCTIVSGANFVSYNSGWVNGIPPVSVDLRTFVGSNGKSLGTNSGRFMLKYSIKSDCGVVNTLTSYLEVSSPIGIGSNLQINSGNGSSWDNNPNTAFPDLYLAAAGVTPSATTIGVGKFSGNMNVLNITGLVTSYAATIQEVNPSTGAFLTTIPSPNTVSGSGNPSGLGINFITSGWFASQSSSLSGRVFRLDVTLYNPCNSITTSVYFMINGNYRLNTHGKTKDKDFGTDWVVAPNPFSQTLSFTLNNADATEGSLQLFNLQGSLVLEKQIDLPQGEQKIDLNTEDLAAGMYLYRLTLNGEQQSGKVIKQP